MIISIDKENQNTIDSCDCHNKQLFVINKKILYIVFS